MIVDTMSADPRFPKWVLRRLVETTKSIVEFVFGSTATKFSKKKEAKKKKKKAAEQDSCPVSSAVCCDSKKKKTALISARAGAKVHPSSRDFWGFW